MERALYKRWKNHPLRTLLQQAQHQQHVYDDQLDDLELPPAIRKATEQAIERAIEAGPQERGLHKTSDTLSAELVDALTSQHPHHETREQRESRRAGEGDAQAIANRRAAREGIEAMADDIHRNAQVR